MADHVDEIFNDGRRSTHERAGLVLPIQRPRLGVNAVDAVVSAPKEDGSIHDSGTRVDRPSRLEGPSAYSRLSINAVHLSLAAREHRPVVLADLCYPGSCIVDPVQHGPDAETACGGNSSVLLI